MEERREGERKNERKKCGGGEGKKGGAEKNFDVHWWYDNLATLELYCVCCTFQGSVAVGGAIVRWLRDNMGIIQSLSEIG